MKAANHLKTVGGCLKRLDQLTCMLNVFHTKPFHHVNNEQEYGF